MDAYAGMEGLGEQSAVTAGAGRTFSAGFPPTRFAEHSNAGITR